MGVKSKLEARQVPVPTLRSHRLVQTKAPSSAKRLRWKEKVLRPGGEALIEAERRVPCRWQTGRSAPLPLCPYRRPRGKALARKSRGGKRVEESNLTLSVHTHTPQKGEGGRGDAMRRGPNTIRRGEAGVESNHSRGRPLPAQNHKEVETRERERQHARLWASKRCRSPLVSVLSPASSSNTESPIASIPNQDHKRTTTLTLL